MPSILTTAIGRWLQTPPLMQPFRRRCWNRPGSSRLSGRKASARLDLAPTRFSRWIWARISPAGSRSSSTAWPAVTWRQSRYRTKRDTAKAWGQLSQYIARGEDGETFKNRFNYSCGRYITLEGLKAEADAVGRDRVCDWHGSQADGALLLLEGSVQSDLRSRPLDLSVQYDGRIYFRLPAPGTLWLR